MNTQTITIHTRLQDNQDGGYSFFGYPSQEALLEDHHLNNGDMSEEVKKRILEEDDPYENGYIGTQTIKVAVDDDGKVNLVGKLHFHAGQ